MTLQERQKREIEALEQEIRESGYYLHIWSAKRVDDHIDSLNKALEQVKSDPETYFKNIDKDETNNS